MKLENKFFNSFFYPFLICVFLSTLIVTIFLGIFTHSYYDKRTIENILNLEEKYSKINIKSVNVILTTILEKNQASINEQILLYQRIANKTLNKNLEDLILHEDNLKCVYDLTDEYLEQNKNILDYLSFWFIDDKIRKFDDIIDIRTKKQIISFPFEFTLTQEFSHYTFLQNDGFWFLSCIWFCYLVFPLLKKNIYNLDKSGLIILVGILL